MTSTWIKIALANIVKNKRRSFFTIVAIAFGFAAVNVFSGFTQYVSSSLRDSVIYLQGSGHLSIFKKGFLDDRQVKNARHLITAKELATIQKICSEEPHIVITSPQLQISGLVSNGSVSTIFIGIGRTPSVLSLIQSKAQGIVKRTKFFLGKPLEDDIIYGAGFTFRLAKKLGLKLDSNAIAMSPTLDGRINAMDVQVFHMLGVPVDALNDKFLAVTLKFAQSLYDTNRVDRINVLLDKDGSMSPVKKLLEQRLKEQGLQMEVRTWLELSPFNTRVQEMFNVIFFFIFVIVFTIVVASVTNTISMSVIERTREIGTLRALGLKRKGVMILFAAESALLSILGCISGMCLTLLTWIMIKTTKPMWAPPTIPGKIPLEVHLIPSYMLISFVFLLLLSVLVSLLPTRRAAKGSIVDALGHV